MNIFVYDDQPDHAKILEMFLAEFYINTILISTYKNVCTFGSGSSLNLRNVKKLIVDITDQLETESIQNLRNLSSLVLILYGNFPLTGIKHFDFGKFSQLKELEVIEGLDVSSVFLLDMERILFPKLKGLSLSTFKIRK